MGPAIPAYFVFNPGLAIANAQQIWGLAEADVIRNGITPQAAADQAFKQIESILSHYPHCAKLRGGHGQNAGSSDGSGGCREHPSDLRGQDTGSGATVCKARITSTYDPA